MADHDKDAQVIRFPDRKALNEGSAEDFELAQDVAEVEALLAGKTVTGKNDEAAVPVSCKFVDVEGSSPNGLDLEYYEDLQGSAKEVDNLLDALIPLIGEFRVKKLAAKINGYSGLLSNITYHEGVIDGFLKGN